MPVSESGYGILTNARQVLAVYNCYFDGQYWRRIDPSRGAAIIVQYEDGTIANWASPPPGDPVSFQQTLTYRPDGTLPVGSPEQLLPNSVGTSQIQDGAVTSSKLADLAVTTAKLADAAVNSAKLADLSVATAKLQDLAVTTTKLADGAVTGPKIANLTIASINLADAAVTTAKIADGAVTLSKLANKFLRQLAPPINVGVATTAVSWTGLSIPLGRCLVIESFINNTLTVNVAYHVRVNGEATSADWVTQYLDASSATASAYRTVDASEIATARAGWLCAAQTVLTLGPYGLLFGTSYVVYTSGIDIAAISLRGLVKNTVINSITQIDIVAHTASGIGPNSKFWLYQFDE